MEYLFENYKQKQSTPSNTPYYYLIIGIIVFILNLQNISCTPPLYNRKGSN